MREEVFETDKKLTPAQYWEWRTTIAAQEYARLKMENVNIKYKYLVLETEFKRIQAERQKFDIQSASENLKAAEKEYVRYKTQLESDLGMSLNNTLIDEITFSVKVIKNVDDKPKE